MILKTNLEDLIEKYDSVFVFDTETTGLDKNNDEIIEFAIAKLSIQNGQIHSHMESDIFINLEDRSLSSTIVSLTGITDQILLSQGIKRNRAANEIVRIIGNGKKLLIAHNANFDLNFLCSMLKKESKELDWNSIDVIDTLSIFRDRKDYPHKLADAINFYNLSNDVRNTHRALDDVNATVLVLDSMCAEKSDISKYINLFGYNPKYKLIESDKISKIKYVEQKYNINKKLYMTI